MLHLFGSDSESGNALDLLKADHEEVKKLFDDYEDNKDDSEDASKQEIVAAICQALTIHATIEEEIFYPAVRKADESDDLLDEATVEHQSVKDLVAQLQAAAPGDELYDAKVKVLSEYVRHHVREEEGEIFPKAKSADLDFDALGGKMAARKQELMQQPMAAGAAAKTRSSKSRSRTKPAAHKTASGAARRAARKKTTRTTGNAAPKSGGGSGRKSTR